MRRISDSILRAGGGPILKWPDDKAEDGGLTLWRTVDADAK